MIASARLATSRATWPWSAAFARVAVVSARRCAWATSESRRSATQRIPVARAIAARDQVGRARAARSRRRRRSRARARAGSRPGSPSAPRSRSRPGRRAAAAGVAPGSARARHPGCPRAPRTACLRSRRRSARGAPTPATASETSSRWSQRGSSGASTCVSIPIAGRYCASLSGRCTPPPPAGGK